MGARLEDIESSERSDG